MLNRHCFSKKVEYKHARPLQDAVEIMFKVLDPDFMAFGIFEACHGHEISEARMNLHFPRIYGHIRTKYAKFLRFFEILVSSNLTRPKKAP